MSTQHVWGLFDWKVELKILSPWSFLFPFVQISSVSKQSGTVAAAELSNLTNRVEDIRLRDISNLWNGYD